MIRKGKLKSGVAAVGWMLVLLLCVVAWSQEPRGAAAPYDTLPAELQGLEIKDTFIPSQGFQEAGRIDALDGHVVVIHRASGEAYFGREGDPVFENDTLETLVDSRCRLRFQNGDVVSMAEETRFGVDVYQDRRQEGKSESLLSMIKGKAMFYALRLFRHKKRRFNVKTPTAVVGVRGTKFGVAVHWLVEPNAQALGVRLADRSGKLGLQLAQMNPQAKSVTDCHSEDGVLDVAGKTVGPGQMYRGRDGEVIPTPPEVLQGFRQATEIRKQGEAQGAAGEGDEEGEDEGALLGGATGDAENLLDLADAMSDIATQQGGEQAMSGGNIAEGKTAGWISGIMAILVDDLAGGDAWGIYEHGPNLLGSGPDQHVAYKTTHDEDPNHSLVLQEQDAEGTKASVTEFSDGTGIPVSGRTFTYFRGGSYTDASGQEYLAWGWWEDLGGGPDQGLVAEDGGNPYYAATAKIWHIEGLRTHPDYIAYLHQQGARYSYSGESKGVFVENGVGAVELTGSFSCQVDYASRSVEDIHIHSANAGYSVDLSGSGSLDSDGEFDIDNLSGKLDTPSTTPQDTIPWATGGGGVICGAKADGIAGAWNAHDGGNLWAAGQFYGKR